MNSFRNRRKSQSISSLSLTNTANLIFPQSVLDLKEDDEYTSENLRRDVLALAPEVAAQPNHQIVDLSKVRGGCVNSEEYLSALQATGGRGVTLFTSPKDSPKVDYAAASNEVLEREETITIPNEEPRSQAAVSLPYKLLLKRFKCHRSNGDTLFGPRQEIYWSTSVILSARRPMTAPLGGTMVCATLWRIPLSTVSRPPWKPRNWVTSGTNMGPPTVALQF